MEGNLADPDSVWHFYQKLIGLRKDPLYQDTFVYGTLVPYLREERNLMAYIRNGVHSDVPGGADSPDVFVAVNMQAEEKTFPLPRRVKKLLLSNLPETEIREDVMTLGPWQAAVMELA